MSQIIRSVPAIVPMTMPAIAPPERVLGHVSEVDYLDERGMGA